MWDLIGWAMVGLILGAIARLLVPDRQPLGLLTTMLLGVIGALLGGAVSWMIWGMPTAPYTEQAWLAYLFAILGAVLTLAFSFGTTSPEYE